MTVVTLDYGQMVPRIIYGLAGIDPSFTDAYSIPGLEGYREGVKKIFNAMLHAKRPLRRFPKNARPLVDSRLSIDEATECIKDFHNPIANAFYAGRGLHFTFYESEILLKVLEELMARQIVALPIHDAVVVAKKYQEITTSVMQEAFVELAGITAVVSVED